MEITVERQEPFTIVALSGNFDSKTAGQVDAALRQQLAAGHARLVLDCAGLGYISSAGLRVLLGALKEVRERGGELRLASVRPTVSRMLHLAGFARVLRVFPNLAAALEDDMEFGGRR